MSVRNIVKEIIDEESAAAKAAKKAGLVHLGFGRYGPKKGGSATHVSKDGKLKSVGDDTAGDPDDSWDDEEGRAKPTGKTDADAWEDDPVGGDNSVNEGSMDWEKHFKGYNEKELKVISKFIWMNPQGIDGVIKMSKKKDFKPFIQKAAKKGLGESLTIKESVNKRIAVKEVYKWLKGLEEYRYRKIPNVDVRRITSFVNNGLSEIDLPKSLQKKWESAKYSKEKNLADRFVKQKISQKLTQTESKHPLKEQYDRLFTDRTVL